MEINLETGEIKHEKEIKKISERTPRVYINDIVADGNNIVLPVGVLSSDIKTTSTNKPYLILRVTDGMTDFYAKKWNHTTKSTPEVGTIIDIKGTVGMYNGSKDFTMIGYRVNKDYSLCDFRSKGIGIIEKNLEVLISRINCIQNPSLRGFVQTIFEYHKKDIKEHPAAIKVHHAYEGGLLQHTVETCEIAIKIAISYLDLNPFMKLDLDLVIAGALLHDLGKFYTYKWEGIAPDINDEGKFMEHIIKGCIEIEKFWEMSSLPKSILTQLQHIIASHHGKLEYGSPVIPSTPEAHIISKADHLSCELTLFYEEQKKGPGWQDKNYFLGTRVYNHADQT